MPKIPERKIRIVDSLCKCFAEYKYVIVVNLDNVSTKQIQAARAKLRNGKYDGQIIVGKNSLIYKALEWLTTKPAKNDPNYQQRTGVAYLPQLKVLIDYIKLNVGLIFTNSSYQELRNEIEADVMELPAKVGVLAPCDVFLPVGPTGVDSGKIDLFHKLNIPVQVAKGNLEITKPFQVIEKNGKVTEAAALMCRTLNLTPFQYTLRFKYVYMNGLVIDEKIICMDDKEILEKFTRGVSVLTGLSLATNLPNKLSAPHFIVNGFMKCLALGVVSGHTFKQLAQAQNAKSSAPTTTGGAAGAKKEKTPEPSEEEADVSMGGMFDSD